VVGQPADIPAQRHPAQHLADLLPRTIPVHSSSTEVGVEAGVMSVSLPALEFISQIYVGGTLQGLSLSLGPNTVVDVVRLANIGTRFPTLYLNVAAVRGLLDTNNRDGSEAPIRNNRATAFYSPVVDLNATVSMQDNNFETARMPNARIHSPPPDF